MIWAQETARMLICCLSVSDEKQRRLHCHLNTRANKTA